MKPNLKRQPTGPAEQPVNEKLEAMKAETLQKCEAEIAAILQKYKARLVPAMLFADGQMQGQVSLRLIS